MLSEKDPLKQIKTSGWSIEIVGIIVSVLNFVVLVSVLFGLSGIIMTSAGAIIIIATSLSIIVGIIFIVLGSKVRKEITSTANKNRFIIVLVISGLALAENIIFGGSSGSILPLVGVGSSIFGLTAIKKIHSKN